VENVLICRRWVLLNCRVRLEKSQRGEIIERCLGVCLIDWDGVRVWTLRVFQRSISEMPGLKGNIIEKYCSCLWPGVLGEVLGQQGHVFKEDCAMTLAPSSSSFASWLMNWAHLFLQVLSPLLSGTPTRGPKQ
jgi:hypothetical protein